ncbi:MAG: hypothetical protein NTX28_07685 [Novosphingobium sp.]|nr:hypothetical protein [Novosphingobium sp.]
MNHEEKRVVREGLRDLARRAAANLIATGAEKLPDGRRALRAAIMAEMNRIAEAENATT